MESLSMLEINKLKKAESLRGKIKEFFTAEQLEELAKNFGVPHYIIMNPVNKEETILFLHEELEDWIRANCLRKNNIKISQTLNFLHFNPKNHSVQSVDCLPKELILIKELYELPLDLITTPPGIYFLCQDEQIVYIGQSLNVADRIATHIAEKTKKFNKVYYIPCHLSNLCVFELALIKKFKPIYNTQRTSSISERDSVIYKSLCKEVV